MVSFNCDFGTNYCIFTDYLGYDATEGVPNYENKEPFFKDVKRVDKRFELEGKAMKSGNEFVSKIQISVKNSIKVCCR
jgi:hypothetical protein